MTLTAAQIRRACALLRWGSPTLAERSEVAYEAVCLARSEDRISGMSPIDLIAVQRVLEKAGVRFAFEPSSRADAVLPDTSDQRRF